MTFEELIEASKEYAKTPLTGERLESYRKRIADKEAEFKREQEAMKITPEWLNRYYDI